MWAGGAHRAGGLRPDGRSPAARWGWDRRADGPDDGPDDASDDGQPGDDEDDGQPDDDDDDGPGDDDDDDDDDDDVPLGMCGVPLDEASPLLLQDDTAELLRGDGSILPLGTLSSGPVDASPSGSASIGPNHLAVVLSWLQAGGGPPARGFELHVFDREGALSGNTPTATRR